MTPEIIAALAAGGESETLELKKSTAERVEAAKTVCAMLNNRGGVVIIGATPDGKVIGQQIGSSTIEDLSTELQRIDPPVLPSIDRVPVAAGSEALVVRVSRGEMVPYRHRNEAFRRVGNTNWKMSHDDEYQMFLERVHGHQRWENQPVEEWSIQDIDSSELLRTVNEAIRSGRLIDPGTRDPEELLLGMGLVKDRLLLRAAVVLFGKEERVGPEFTQCLLRAARFRGVDRTEFLDNRQFRGNVFSLLSHAERFLRDNLPVAGYIPTDSFVRIDEPLYPTEALREALANAFCHRDYTSGGGSVSIGIYDNCLEVTSTGPLHFGLTSEMLFQPHDSQPWNPLIANAFYLRGIIERWGRGTIKMAELTAEAGLPRPDIEDVGGSVTVRFQPSRYVPPQRVGRDLTEQEREILQILDTAPYGLAFRDILSRLSNPYSDQQVRYALQSLKDVNLAISRGRARGAKWERLRIN